MINLKFLLSCFGNFDDIKPQPDNYTYFIDKFKFLGNVLPNIIQEVNSSGKQNDRLTMRTSDNSWEISFLSNRINIEWTNKFTKDQSVLDFIAVSRIIIDVILKKTGSKFNRIGMVTSYLYDNKNKEQLDKLYHKFNVPNEIFEGLSLIEWSNRSVIRKSYKFEDGDEILNIVNEIKRVQGSLMKAGRPEPIEGIEVRIDINTFANTQSHRFDLNKTSKFLDLLYTTESEIQSVLNNKITTT